MQQIDMNELMALTQREMAEGRLSHKEEIDIYRKSVAGTDAYLAIKIDEMTGLLF